MTATTITSSPVDLRKGAPATPPASTATGYDHVAQDYDRLIRPKYESIARRVALAVEASVPDLRSAVALELSAGTGALTHLLAPLVGNYVATDISLPMLDVARERGGAAMRRVAWLPADVEALQLPSHLADLVVSSLGPVQDTPVALAEARRTLVPGGCLVACTWGDDYSELALLQDARRRLGVDPREVTTADDVRGRFTAAGFRDITVTPFRLAVVHESVPAYLAYRGAFGAAPLPHGLSVDLVLEALREAAAAYLDDDGRVLLDWHLLLATGLA